MQHYGNIFFIWKVQVCESNIYECIKLLPSLFTTVFFKVRQGANGSVHYIFIVSRGKKALYLLAVAFASKLAL